MCNRLRSFLTTCRKEIDIFVEPLAARKPKLSFPYRLAALTVWRAKLYPTVLPQAVTMNTPEQAPPEQEAPY